MKSGSHRRDTPCNALPAHKWRRLRVLQDVCHLNQNILDELSSLAKSGSTDAPRLVLDDSDLWASMDPEAVLRAAQMPVLLLDLKFQDAMWWRDVSLAAMTRSVCGPSDGSMVSTRMTQFCRQALILVWPAVRDDRLSTSLLFGMSEQVASVIGGLSPRELDNVSLQHGHEMQLRWEHAQGFWRKLLSAAQSGDMDMLRNLHLCGLQMLGGEFMRARSGIETCVPGTGTRRYVTSAH
jgi:hypothetical protein